MNGILSQPLADDIFCELPEFVQYIEPFCKVMDGSLLFSATFPYYSPDIIDNDYDYPLNAISLVTVVKDNAKNPSVLCNFTRLIHNYPPCFLVNPLKVPLIMRMIQWGDNKSKSNLICKIAKTGSEMIAIRLFFNNFGMYFGQYRRTNSI